MARPRTIPYLPSGELEKSPARHTLPEGLYHSQRVVEGPLHPLAQTSHLFHPSPLLVSAGDSCTPDSNPLGTGSSKSGSTFSSQNCWIQSSFVWNSGSVEKSHPHSPRLSHSMQASWLSRSQLSSPSPVLVQLALRRAHSGYYAYVVP